MLVVDPCHWLEKDGSLPSSNRRLRKRILRIAQFIEAAATIPRGTTRETLIQCSRRPSGRACDGLMWVMKNEDDAIFAYCIACDRDEAFIHNWQETEWAEGPMEPVPVEEFSPTEVN